MSEVIKEQVKNEQVNNEQVHSYVLQNALGMRVELNCLGATLVDVCVPDRAGAIESVLLAHESAADWRVNAPYFGATIGRTAGRIAHGQFGLAGAVYQLPCNQGLHQLHGGAGAMSHQAWQVLAADELGVTFAYDSPAGENGYPNALRVVLRYELSATEHRLSLDFSATCDGATLCNLTNHAYFNLSGKQRRTIHAHELTVEADWVCAMDGDLLVTGDEWAVAGSAFDFRTGALVGSALASGDERLALAQGLDHYFVLNNLPDHAAAVQLQDAQSGRRLRVFTDQPCVVLYAHNNAGGEVLRHGGRGVTHDALCIETQKLPHRARPNGDHPSALYPEQVYRQRTAFLFDVV